MQLQAKIVHDINKKHIISYCENDQMVTAIDSGQSKKVSFFISAERANRFNGPNYCQIWI